MFRSYENKRLFINDIIIKGNKKISDKKILDKLIIDKGDILNFYKINDSHTHRFKRRKHTRDASMLGRLPITHNSE